MKPARVVKPKQPTVVVIAGPNGAGKSTAAPFLLKQALGILEFVNADQIAARQTWRAQYSASGH